MTQTLELTLGTGVLAPDVFDDAGQITVSRGIKRDGVLDKLEPGELKVLLEGAGYFPDVNTGTRMNRPVVLQLHDTDVSPHFFHIFTGKIDDVGLHPARTPTAESWIDLSCLDAVADLAKVKTFDSTGGSLTQRVDAALVDADITYVVNDPDAAGATPALTTDAKSATDQLRRVVDTAHAIAYVNGDNWLQVYADSLRPSGPAVLTLTDGTGPGDADFIDVDRDASLKGGFINDLTLTRLDTDETLTVTDRTTTGTYGAQHQDVTVLEGDLEDHAWRFMALRYPPVDTVRSVTINATLSDIWLTVAQLNPYDIVDVVSDGTTYPSRVLYLEHVITPRKGQSPKWMVRLDLARLDLAPIAWDDVPAGITWDDVPATVSWNSAATWHPEI